jgi:glucose/arabinose dehydrogenase
MNTLIRIAATGAAALAVNLCGDSNVAVMAQATLPTGFVDDVVLTGLTKPTAVRFSPDGRVFVAEKSGIIKVFDSLSDSSPTVFTDLRTNVHNYWDRGLLGLALDPGFPTRPYVYVLYTYDGSIGGTAPAWGVPGATSDGCPDPPGGTAEGCVVSARVSRLQAAGNVMTGTEKVLVHDWFQQFPGHSIGSLAFGADGALYASGGEGASFQFVDYGQIGNPGDDPPGGSLTPPSAEGGALRSQDVRTSGDRAGLNGAVIRIDPATGAALPDNPMYSHTDTNAKRIVAYGLRNPFRMAVRPGTRELWIGDVGWRTWEEIDVVPDPLAAPVRNFGWPCYEGSSRQSGYDATNLTLCESLYAQAAVTVPYYAYKDSTAVVSGETCPNGSSSITGLAFYTGTSYPAKYRNALFFADYSRRCIWVMYAGANGVPDPATRATFVQGAGYPVDLQVGPNGDVFYVNLIQGTIHRLLYTSVRPPTPRIVPSATFGKTPLTVSFDGTGSSDPDGGTLSFSWDLDGDGTFGDSTTATASYTYATAGDYEVRLKVTDPDGLSGVASVTVHAGNTPPSPVIDAPLASLRWRVGQTIAFSGRASDEQDGSLPASALTWSLIMNHCSTSGCHEHGIQDYPGVAAGSFVAPDHEYPSHLVLRLTAKDSKGIEASTTLRLDPQTVDLTVQSNPAGLQVVIGSETMVAPTRPVIVGSRVSIGAPSPQTLANTVYAFARWSDDGPQTHTVEVGTSDVTYTATYASKLNPADRVIHAAHATARVGNWQSVPDSTAASGARMEQPNLNAAKLTTPLAAPANYFEAKFHAEAQRAYRVWIRGKAANNYYGNDSVFAQFTDSVDINGAAVYRIGTTSGTPLIVEECNGCGMSGWGWEDNGYGGVGPLIYFGSTGTQTIRIQGREDGISIDQIVLSPVTYLTTRPGLTKNDATLLPEQTGLATAPQDVVLHVARSASLVGAWHVVEDTSAASGARLENPDAGLAKLITPLAAPQDYFEVTFGAEAGRPYRLWLRGRAHDNSYSNDSVFVQFSQSVDAAGTAVFRIGTPDATPVVIEDCSGCGISGWGWPDNGYGTVGPLIYFEKSGLQTIRVQRREDGISIDQIVLSPASYLTARPGAMKNDTTILPEQTGLGTTSDDVVLHVAQAATLTGAWRVVPDTSAAGDARLENPDAGLAKLLTPLAVPQDYFEATFDAEAGQPYRLWLRGRAYNNSYTNDSVFVQFSHSTDAAGAEVFRIGSTSATAVVIENCSGCGLSGWGWVDNGYGSVGPLIYFAKPGLQTIRVQRREDGISIDQIVLSPSTYLTAAPGASKNDTRILAIP